MKNILYKTTSTAINGRNGKVSSDDSNLDVNLSLPKGLGGEGGDGTNPEQLLGAAYAACVRQPLSLSAKEKGIALDKDSTVAAIIELGKTKQDNLQLRATFDDYLPGIEA